MANWRLRSLRIGSAIVLSLFVCAATALPQQAVTGTKPTSDFVLTLDPAQSKVHWTVDSALHTVHGTFALKSGTIHFDPVSGRARGVIIVYAPSGESGNGSRDKRMHREILETAKYPDVIFHPAQVDGTVSRSGASEVKLSGTFSIHGADHDLTAQVHAELAGDRWSGTSRFAVPYVQWGIRDPSNFLLKVQPVVNVELEMVGTVTVSK